MAPASPATEHLASSLAWCLGVAPAELVVEQVSPLAPGLSGAAAYRVRARAVGAAVHAVLKVPEEAAPTLIAPQDPLVDRREALFYGSGLAEELADGLRPARLIGIDRRGAGAWLWVEDVSAALAVAWTTERILRAAAASARLHRLFRAHRNGIEGLPWLEREGHAAHAHHVAAAHRNLDRLGQDARWSGLLDAAELPALHRALDLAGWAAGQMARLPHSLVHGDYHPGNLGFDPDGTVVAIDWAHAGLAPLGCDAATLVSLGEAFGGVDLVGEEGEEAVLAAYVDALVEEGEPGAIREIVRRAAGMWHATWGLHLRLGPGLTSLFRQRDRGDAELAPEADDVRDGCRRALRFLHEEGVLPA